MVVSQESRLTRALHWVRDQASEDHSLDGLCVELRALGVKAKVNPRQHRRDRLDTASVGAIEIEGHPIQRLGSRHRSDGEATVHTLLAFIPDARLGNETRSRFKLHSVRVKRPSIIGKTVDIRWKGSAGRSGLVEALNSQFEVRRLFVDKSYRSLKIESAAPRGVNPGGWRVSVELADDIRPEDAIKTQWAHYEELARRLLRGDLSDKKP